MQNLYNRVTGMNVTNAIGDEEALCQKFSDAQLVLETSAVKGINERIGLAIEQSKRLSRPIVLTLVGARRTGRKYTLETALQKRNLLSCWLDLTEGPLYARVLDGIKNLSSTEPLESRSLKIESLLCSLIHAKLKLFIDDVLMDDDPLQLVTFQSLVDLTNQILMGTKHDGLAFILKNAHTLPGVFRTANVSCDIGENEASFPKLVQLLAKLARQVNMGDTPKMILGVVAEPSEYYAEINLPVGSVIHVPVSDLSRSVSARDLRKCINAYQNNFAVSRSADVTRALPRVVQMMKRKRFSELVPCSVRVGMFLVLNLIEGFKRDLGRSEKCKLFRRLHRGVARFAKVDWASTLQTYPWFGQLLLVGLHLSDAEVSKLSPRCTRLYSNIQQLTDYVAVDTSSGIRRSHVSWTFREVGKATRPFRYCRKARELLVVNIIDSELHESLRGYVFQIALSMERALGNKSVLSILDRDMTRGQLPLDDIHPDVSGVVVNPSTRKFKRGKVNIPHDGQNAPQNEVDKTDSVCLRRGGRQELRDQATTQARDVMIKCIETFCAMAQSTQVSGNVELMTGVVTAPFFNSIEHRTPECGEEMVLEQEKRTLSVPKGTRVKTGSTWVTIHDLYTVPIRHANLTLEEVEELPTQDEYVFRKLHRGLGVVKYYPAIFNGPIRPGACRFFINTDPAVPQYLGVPGCIFAKKNKEVDTTGQLQALTSRFVALGELQHAKYTQNVVADRYTDPLIDRTKMDEIDEVVKRGKLDRERILKLLRPERDSRSRSSETPPGTHATFLSFPSSNNVDMELD